MNSKLLAFRVAKPVTSLDPVEGSYDPASQTTVWVGNSKATASLGCTPLGLCCYVWQNCNAYGNYCNTWGKRQWGGVTCDNF
jgi:hypothetical protein